MMPANPVSTLFLPLAAALTALLAAAAVYDIITFRRRRIAPETVYRCNTCRHIYT